MQIAVGGGKPMRGEEDDGGRNEQTRSSHNVVYPT
jgi:hypothetical protein